MIRLLNVAFDDFCEGLEQRLADTPYNDVRISHGCVFGNIDPDGTRLTDLAERARMTKQSVGEITSDLEQRGYVERVPDPSDGRAKIIRLTERGRAAQALGFGLIDEIEQEWAERFGAERVAALREALEAITAEQTRRRAGMSEAKLEGGVPVTAGWFVVNARDARWLHNEMRAVCRFSGEGGAHFDDLGVGLYWIQPGKPMSLYHHEAGQEDFLVLRGRATVIVEGQERRGRALGPRPLPAEDSAHDRRRRRGAGADPRRGRAQGEGQRALPGRAGCAPPRCRRPRRVDLGARDLRELRRAPPGSRTGHLLSP